jgi:hypothetical protein
VRTNEIRSVDAVTQTALEQVVCTLAMREIAIRKRENDPYRT